MFEQKGGREVGLAGTWLCDSGASIRITPSADGMINYRECNLKLRIADGSTRMTEEYGDILFLSFDPATVSYK